MVVLRVYGGVLVDAGKRWHACLCGPGKCKTAYLDKSRIKAFYRDGRGRYYVVYESSSPYYEDVAVKLPEDAERVTIREFTVDPWWLRPARHGRRTYYHVYLRELEEWDEQAWGLCTAVDIWLTNIHPYYGVMD